ncbi:hypothetical protein GGD56_006572 [Rhizobium mongolense]|uniref:Uncharacterized protein n=1 Tax=Rhizobium mongolense TaxID=57676 RepID=A0ABR6IXM1_9HYPH|nr:hypothetical protein [Rhizobium mongolense]
MRFETSPSQSGEPLRACSCIAGRRDGGKEEENLEKYYAAWKRIISSFRSIFECVVMPVPIFLNHVARRRQPARDRASSSRHSSLRKYRRAASPLARFSLGKPKTADEISDPAPPKNDPADEWRISHPILWGTSLFTSSGMYQRPNGDPLHAPVASMENPLSRIPFDTRDGRGTRLIPRPRDQRKALHDLQTFSSHRSTFSQRSANVGQ